MESNTARKLAQIAPEALLVGVDPHKHTHAIVIMTQQARIVAKFKIKNNRSAYEHLLEAVETAVTKVGADGAIFAIEAGGHYWRNLSYYLQEEGKPFRLISPFTLKRRREGDDLTRRKTDYRDATAAAELLRTGQFTETRLPQKEYAELRSLHQARRRLIKASTRERNLLRALLDGVFPEFAMVFKDLTGQTALAALTACPVPAAIAALPVQEFVQQVRGAASGKRLALKKLREVHALAAPSIGVQAGAQSVHLELQLLVQRLCLLREQTAQVEHQLVTLVQHFAEYAYIRSIPGLGVLTAAGLIAEIGPLAHYGDAKDLVKLAGSNPICSESADKGSPHTPMSKKGRAGLRAGLWQAALGLLRSNPAFQSWAKRLRERQAADHPLHKREIVGAAMNKLLRLYFALVSKKQVYHPRVASGELIAA